MIASVIDFVAHVAGAFHCVHAWLGAWSASGSRVTGFDTVAELSVVASRVDGIMETMRARGCLNATILGATDDIVALDRRASNACTIPASLDPVAREVVVALVWIACRSACVANFVTD